MLDARKLTRAGIAALAAVPIGSLLFIANAHLQEVRVGGVELQTRMEKIAAKQASPSGFSNPTADIIAMSMFNVASPAPGAPGEASAPTNLKLVGVSRTPRRRAVLVSVDGAAPVWVELGKSSDQIELLSIEGGAARVRTRSGESRLVLFQSVAPAAAPLAPGSPTSPVAAPTAPSPPSPSPAPTK